jgi:hypothetical protein
MNNIIQKINDFKTSNDLSLIDEINNDINDEIENNNSILNTIDDIEGKEYKKYTKYSIEELYNKMSKTDDINKMIKLYESALFKLNNS